MKAYTRLSWPSPKCLRSLQSRALIRFASNAAPVSPESLTYDIVIVGGGPAGLSLATALKATESTKHFSIALVDGAPLSHLRDWKNKLSDNHFENRVSSLTARTARFLRKIGAWDNLVMDRVTPYSDIQTWDGVSGSRLEFDAFSLNDADEMAFMVENANLQQALLSRLDELGEKILDNARIERVEREGWPVVYLQNGRQLKARLLVGADGQRSIVRQFAGIASRGWDYDRHGVVASLRTEYESVITTAYQRFLPTGPLAMLPLPGTHASLVWSTTPKNAAFLKQLSPEAFSAMVNAGFRLEPVDLAYLHSLDPHDTNQIIDEVSWRLAVEEERVADANHAPMDAGIRMPATVVAVEPDTVASFPMKMRNADSYIGDRVALVGDAAHATHPLAGQGLNMGQRDVEFLVDAFEIAVGRGLDIGSAMALDQYWKEAYFRDCLKIGVADKMHALFGTDWWPVVQVRSLGMSIINSCDAAKQFLIKQAMN